MGAHIETVTVSDLTARGKALEEGVLSLRKYLLKVHHKAQRLSGVACAGEQTASVFMVPTF